MPTSPVFWAIIGALALTWLHHFAKNATATPQHEKKEKDEPPSAATPPAEFGTIDPIKWTKDGLKPVLQFAMDRSGGIYQLHPAAKNKVWTRLVQTGQTNLVEGPLDLVINEIIGSAGVQQAELQKAA